MCGIAGIFKPLGGVAPEEIRAVERMTSALTHRGPNDEGLYHDDWAALGHRRLSIIDLSPAGHQPMTNEDASVWVTYNGEIYNYRELGAELKAAGHNFHSSSDTEVLLHGYEQWGIEGLLRRLRGMFVFALYDARKRRCFLARDRFGIKPLYYTEQGGGQLAFASEVKALVKGGIVPGEKDREAIIGFLLFGSVPAPLTFIRDIRCLMPGHFLVADQDAVAIHKYWDLEGNFEDHDRPSASADELKTILEDSVARHLVSDVPVGIFLSGGVDSAGLVALASRTDATLTTLTVVFDEQEFSEAAPARRVAERFHTDHREVRVTAEDFIQEVPRLLAAMDQPTNDGVNTYFVSQAAKRAGLTVVLSGLGGDEIFWGYGHYRWLATSRDPVRWLAILPPFIRKAILHGAVGLGRLRGRESWMRLGFLSGGLTSENLYLAVRGFFAPEQIARLLDMDERELRTCLGRYCSPADGHGVKTGLGAFSHLEARRYMHDQLLRDTDTYSMAHSIEVRVPYLDHEITKLAAAIPAENKRPRATNKPALAEAIGDHLVSELARGRKRGFTFPFAQWMRKNSAQLQESTGESKLLDQAAVGKLWASFTAGRLHWSRVWALAVLGADR